MKTIIVLFIIIFSPSIFADMPTIEEVQRNRDALAIEQKEAHAECKKGFGLPSDFAWMQEMSCKKEKELQEQVKELTKLIEVMKNHNLP